MGSNLITFGTQVLRPKQREVSDPDDLWASKVDCLDSSNCELNIAPETTVRTSTFNRQHPVSIYRWGSSDSLRNQLSRQSKTIPGTRFMVGSIWNQLSWHFQLLDSPRNQLPRQFQVVYSLRNNVSGLQRAKSRQHSKLIAWQFQMIPGRQHPKSSAKIIPFGGLL